MNPDLITNIKPSKIPLHMPTNAGTKKMTMQSNIDKFGYVCYSTTLLINTASPTTTRKKMYYWYTHMMEL